MIDTDKYEEQLEDDNTDTWVVWRIAKESIEEVKRLHHMVEVVCKYANLVAEIGDLIYENHNSYELTMDEFNEMLKGLNE